MNGGRFLDTVYMLIVADDKSSWHGAWTRSCDILEFYTPWNIYETAKLEISNFVHELATWSIILVKTNCSQVDVIRVIHFYILGPGHTFGAV